MIGGERSVLVVSHVNLGTKGSVENRALVNEKSGRCMSTDKYGVIEAGHIREEEILECVFSMHKRV